MLEPRDWVRLSLDSGSDATFQRMHKPSKKSLTLDEICAWIPKIKAANPAFAARLLVHHHLGAARRATTSRSSRTSTRS